MLKHMSYKKDKINKFWHLIKMLSCVCDITGCPINHAFYSMHDIISHSKLAFRSQFKKSSYGSSYMWGKGERLSVR
jgi:hypothetical protein